MERKIQFGMDETINPLLQALTLKRNQSNNPSVYDLNDDCLAEIFSYLPIADRVRSERVCKRWQAVIQQSWRTLKKLNLSRRTWCLPKKGGQHVDFVMLREVLMRCGPHLKYLDLSNHSELLNSESLWIVSKYCPNIKTVDLSHFTMSSRIAYEFSRKCRNIQELSLGECRQSSEKNLSRLFRFNKNLRYLHFNRSIDISGQCLTHLPTEVIEEITFQYCRNIESYWLNRSLEKFTNLSSLTFIWCSDIDEWTLKILGTLTKITKLIFYPDSLRPLPVRAMHNLAHLVNLEKLDLLHMSLITDDLLIDIAINCTRLKILDIHDCGAVTNRGVIGLLENAENLIVLTVVGTNVTHEIFKVADEVANRRKKDQLTIFYSRIDFSEPIWPSSPFLRIIYEEY